MLSNPVYFRRHKPIWPLTALLGTRDEASGSCLTHMGNTGDEPRVRKSKPTVANGAKRMQKDCGKGKAECRRFRNQKPPKAISEARKFKTIRKKPHSCLPERNKFKR